MKIALGQINTTVGAIDANVDRMLEYASRAQEAGRAADYFSGAGGDGLSAHGPFAQERFYTLEPRRFGSIAAKFKWNLSDCPDT